MQAGSARRPPVYTQLPSKPLTRHTDRFIPRRSDMDMSASRHLLSHDSAEDDDIISKDKLRLRQEALRSLLEQVMFPEGLQSRVLVLGTSRNPPVPRPDSWPVRPRYRPCIARPDAILDLPAFDPSPHVHILDWGAGGILAAALQRSVFLCDLNAASTEQLTRFCDGHGSCVLFNPLGDLLAVANTISAIQVWEPAARKLIVETACYCAMQRHGKCSVNALAWHPDGTHVASGCSWGTLVTWPPRDPQDMCVVVRAHRGAITSLGASPDGRYLASCGTDGALRVWRWPDLRPHMEITSQDHCTPVHAWHPWRPSVLAVGSHCLAVYNVNNASLLTRQDFSQHFVSVSCLAWSRLTGELVVSLWVHGDEFGETDDHAEVLVLASAKKVVDKLDILGSAGKVLYLMWSPDGKKIATASTDETLQVWTFLKDAASPTSQRRPARRFGAVLR
ncbi:protein cortex-like [Bacillus rossius redtenbacheri]|uniref:protein cortex-like n=1 Tax=Bacillus rossius redtenbacheri TaxID=93214 RepID=UPI002FDCE776